VEEDHPDKIDFIEFLSIMARLTLYKEDQSKIFRNSFNVFADKDGHIHLDKLKEVLYKLGEPLTSEHDQEFN
jgi:Ca2+-binding EF-hand superfamily protein